MLVLWLLLVIWFDAINLDKQFWLRAKNIKSLSCLENLDCVDTK